MKRKNQLLYSVLSLLLCVSMLLGTTFAWFTDSVETGINTIAAGNLDVELYHSNAAVQNEKVDASTELFMDLNGKDILWEPGVVSYENLRVVNEGDLALAYQLALNTANENYIVDPATGAQYGLSQVLQVGVVEGGITATDRDSVVASVAAANWTTLTNFLRSGSLLPEGAGESEKTWGVVIYWKPGVNDNFWNLNNGKTLNEGDALTIDLGVKLIATQEVYENDSFGDDYDTDAKAFAFPDFVGGSATAAIEVDAQGRTVADVTMTSGKIKVFVPAGVQVKSGVTKLSMSVSEMTSSGANVSLGENEDILSLDVHVEGVADNNTVPITVTLAEVAPTGLNMGNYKLYHVESTGTKEMTLVDAAADFNAHNQFKYDPATGDVALHMATFSEVAVVADTVNPWEGEVDHSWYVDKESPYTIANADQLWSFSQIVGGMAKNEKGEYVYTATTDGNEYHNDSFAGKTVKLISDINLGDKETENNSKIIFYPIGYYNSEGTYERTNTAITSGLRNFEGTFDGNGHTVSNFYQNTWEMKGDHNWYSPEEQYYRDGMGLFGRVYKGTVKNLTVKEFKSDGEITTTGCIAAYADGATFENIAIFDCNPRVYNIGNGGIVGCVGWYAKEANLKTTFKNITVDNSNKISALWGSYDVACGGIVGQYYVTSGQSSANTPKNGGIHFENCHISAQMDVYNDVCANYQYYAYRYTGMLIGSVSENVTIDGHSYPKMDKITAKDCTVHFGTWNDYYYCEFEKNGHPSYSGPDDYKFSRIPHSEINFTDSNGNGIIDTEDERASVTGCKHTHTAAEDQQCVYLEFNNLVTGYGWGVTSKGVDDLDGVKILDREVGNSVEKFEGKVTELANNKEYKLGDIFKFVDKGVKLIPGALAVSVNNLDENNPVSAEFKRDAENWENGTLTLDGTGEVQITIQDYYFCTPTTINVTITDRQPEEKFDIVMNNGDFLHRVGNSGTVALDKLFKAKDGVSVGTVSVNVEAVNGTSASGTYSNNAIQFSGTGVVKVTITDNDYCTPTTLTLEVVDATNVTGLSGAITSNVVLLNDCGLSSLTISGRNAVYGNGFTATYTGTGRYLNNGINRGVVMVQDNGVIDNLRIVASVYPRAYLYHEEAKKGPSDGNNRFDYQLSAVGAFGNARIQNCYISGGRTNIYIGNGNVTVQDSVLECGTLANVQIVSSDEYSVIFEDVTTIQHQMNATVDDTTAIMYGAGILVGDGDKDNATATAPAIVLNGAFKQYNWVTEADKNAVSDSNAKMIIGGALDATAFNHTVNEKTASNLGIIFLNDFNDTPIQNHTGLPYAVGTVYLNLGFNVGRKVYSLKNASPDQIYSDAENADCSTINGLYQPQFEFKSDLGGQLIPDDGGDEFCYRDGDAVKVMFPSGDTKVLDLAGLVNIAKYTDQNLSLVITCKDSNGKAVAVENGKIALSAAGEYTVTYSVTDTLFYNAAGNKISNSLPYSWDIIVDVSLKDVAIPNAYFEFDSSKQVIYRSGSSNIVQFIPFLAGLKIYDYNGQTAYLRFDGDNDFNKIAKASINNVNTTGEAQGYHIVTIELVDGGKLIIDMDVRANSGSSTHSGSIKVRSNVIYVVNGGTTSGKGQTWKIYSYKFIGNNGTEINSGLVTFGTAGVDCSTATKPSSNFGTTVKYTVTYDANGGNCGQTIGYATSVAAAVTLPTPTKSGYIFAGWYTAASGGTRVGGAGDSYTPSANITLHAQWGKPCTVTYNANGGSCGTASEKYTGNALTLPTPTRDGYWFIGWYDAANGGNKIGDAGAKYNPSGEITLYAHWQEKVEYTVTYNANGGTCGTASATYQGTVLTLPTPTRTGYTFNGWYTAASGGTKIGAAGASYTPSANITLYAQWKINSYTITVTTNNATVKVNGTEVKNSGTVSIQYGAQVTVEVTYSKSDERSTTIEGTDGTTYTSPFTMPAQNVTINATSSDSCLVEGTLVTMADGTQKAVEDLKVGDMIMVFNHVSGKLEAMPLIFNTHADENEAKDYDVLYLQFSNGKEAKIVQSHGFFDMTLMQYVYINYDNYQDFIGHEFYALNSNGTSGEKVELVKAFIKTEKVRIFCPVTYFHMNSFANGLLNTPNIPGDITGLVNYFEYDSDLKYNEEAMQQDIEEYGLYTYEDFSEYISEAAYNSSPSVYLKVAVGKGMITYEQIIDIIQWLLEGSLIDN